MNMDHDTIFFLYANCIPVNGVKRSCIYDLQRQEIFYIPNGFHEILTIHKGKNIKDIKSVYSDDLAQNIDIFFNFLLDNKLGFFTDEPDRFPNLSTSWYSPEPITNCILEYGLWTDKLLTTVCEQLNDLRCKFVEFRCYNKLSYEQLYNYLTSFKTTFVKDIRLLIRFSPEIMQWDFNELLLDNQRVGSLVFHSSPSSSIDFGNIPKGIVYCNTDEINNNTHCGNVSIQNMAVNISMFTESMSFNSCLNRKISIDEKGNIKNCPSMQETFGNINTTSLVKVSLEKQFRKVWLLSKDKINICQSCEYRYACLDCRAYTEDPSTPDAKPLKCGYDPVTEIWEDWAKNPIKINKFKRFFAE